MGKSLLLLVVKIKENVKLEVLAVLFFLIGKTGMSAVVECLLCARYCAKHFPLYNGKYAGTKPRREKRGERLMNRGLIK